MSASIRDFNQPVYDSNGLPFNADSFLQATPQIIGGKTYYQQVKYYRGTKQVAEYNLQYDADANIISAVVTLF